MLQLGIVSIGMTLILFVGQVSIMVSTKVVTQLDYQPNPLRLYQSTFSGVAIGELGRYACTWYIERDSEYMRSSCDSLQLDEDHFYLMDIQAQNQIIVGIGLKVENLCIGDLPQQWGQPVVEPYGRYTFARWFVDDYTVTAYSYTNRERFNYWSPISYMVIRQIWS